MKRTISKTKILILLIFFALLSPQATYAQQVSPISSEEWRSVLDGIPRTEDSLFNASTKLLDESTDLINAGRRGDSVRKNLMGIVLARHAYSINGRNARPEGQRVVRSLDAAQTALIQSGVPESAFAQSETSLRSVLGAATPIPARRPIRRATPAERAAIIASVKKELIDPTSPIFGELGIVGETACITVNAKNRLGGYTGNKEILAVRINGKWSSGGSFPLPHALCLSALARPDQ